MDRTILHCDCNGFYASVECVRQPSLREVPMAVCGDPESRHGIILAKNERAKAFSIVTAETVWQAKKKCPDLVLVRAHHDDYAAFSRRVNDIYARYTDMVELFGIDESWLDVTASHALFGDGRQIADELRRVVREETGLTISVGVSFNKAFAKLGSDYRKPDATTVFAREDVERLVYPLPVGSLLFVGKAAEKTLAEMYIRTIGDLAHADRAFVVARLGKLGEMLHDYACGLDDSPVRKIGEKSEPKSVGNGMTFRRDLRGYEELRVGVSILADEVATRLRRQGLYARAVQIAVKDPALRVRSRQRTLAAATDLAQELTDAVMALLREFWPEGAPVRMLTVTAMQLTDTRQEQLSLFEQDGGNHERQAKLERAMDSIRQKYGTASIRSAAVLGQDFCDISPEEESGKPPKT